MTDPNHDITGDEGFSFPRRAAYGAVMIIVVTIAGLVLAEGLLRVLPIRGLTYQTFYYDELTGGHHYPGSTVTYRTPDGSEIERRVNDWGFLDVAHTTDKPVGTVRIGIFGDSYTESRQVALDDTFFRRLQSRLDAGPGGETGSEPAPGSGADRYEVLAMGVSGRSTLQSYLECTRWMARADLDIVVYVFSENDAGDQLRQVTKVDVIPYAELSGDTFVVDDDFRERYAYKTSRLHRLAQLLKARSLVMSTIEQRLRLLRRHGVALDTGGDGDDREAGLRATAPSTWPPELVTYGERLGERIIVRWRNDVEASGRRFLIVRVPRESQINRPIESQDAWAPWLHRLCERHSIQLIDPTERFQRAIAAGEAPYGDHFTPAGHRLFEEALHEGLSDPSY